MRGKAGKKSRVIPVRLSEEIPEEAEVLSIVDTWREAGTLRQNLVECVLAQHSKIKSQPRSVQAAYSYMNRRLGAIEDLLHDLQNGYVRVEAGQFVMSEPEFPVEGGRRLSLELQDNISSIVSDVTYFGDDDE